MQPSITSTSGALQTNTDANHFVWHSIDKIETQQHGKVVLGRPWTNIQKSRINSIPWICALPLFSRYWSYLQDLRELMRPTLMVFQCARFLFNCPNLKVRIKKSPGLCPRRVKSCTTCSGNCNFSKESAMQTNANSIFEHKTWALEFVLELLFRVWKVRTRGRLSGELGKGPYIVF